MTTNFDEKSKTWDEDPKKVRRAQKIANEIQERIPLSKAMSALEYGCGIGFISFELQPLKSI